MRTPYLQVTPSVVRWLHLLTTASPAMFNRLLDAPDTRYPEIFATIVVLLAETALAEDWLRICAYSS